MTWLIDASGKLWPTAAHPTTHWDTECDPLGFVVSDLGFIHLHPLNQGLKVIFNPSRVGWKTMISAFYVIADEQPNRIVLSNEGTYPTVEIYGTVARALRRIEELVETHPHPTAVVARRRRSLGRLTKPMTEVLRTWKNASGKWSPAWRTEVRSVVPLDDTMVTVNPRGTSQLVTQHWGANFDFLGPRWLEIARGKNTEDQPFPELGRRFAMNLRRTLADGAPRLEEIDVALSNDGVTTRRRRYSRLLLPTRGQDGDRYVTQIKFDQNTSVI